MTTAISTPLAPATPSPRVTRPAPRGQILRFGLVGGLNTAIDALAFNALLWAFEPRATWAVLLANACAYALGAINSFALNKYWTFGSSRPTTRDEVARFMATTLGGIALNDALLWVIGGALLATLGPTPLWATTAKIASIGGTVLISYLGMRFWVFARRAPAATEPRPATPALNMINLAYERRLTISKTLARHGISVVLPAYNEEQVILTTLADVMGALTEWGADFEVVVVNDGSADRTGELVAAYAAREPRVRLVTHTTNQGYGAALTSGFAAATRDLTFFMDADGQFTIRDLALLLVYIEDVDAVLGYRIHRQDSALRLLNAWGWMALVRVALGVRVRDLDCAFKLIRTEFLRAHPPTTGSALINAELVYTLNRTGATYRQVGVRHLPRRGGRATGASLRVIVRAMWDLATQTRRWRRRVYAHP